MLSNLSKRLACSSIQHPLEYEITVTVKGVDHLGPIFTKLLLTFIIAL